MQKGGGGSSAAVAPSHTHAAPSPAVLATYYGHAVPYLNPRYSSAVPGGGPASSLSVTVSVDTAGLYGGDLVWREPSLSSNSSWCPHNQVGRALCTVSSPDPSTDSPPPPIAARRRQVLRLVCHPRVRRGVVQRERRRLPARRRRDRADGA